MSSLPPGNRLKFYFDKENYIFLSIESSQNKDFDCQPGVFEYSACINIKNQIWVLHVTLIVITLVHNVTKYAPGVYKCSTTY